MERTVASSGDYERPHHILDPRTGYPAQGMRGVTLVARELEAVNGLGPAIMVLGMEAGKRLMEGAGIEGMLVDTAGQLWSSPGLRLD